ATFHSPHRPPFTFTPLSSSLSFFFNHPAPPEIYTFPYTTLFRSRARLLHRPRPRATCEGAVATPFARLRPARLRLAPPGDGLVRSEEHTSELQSLTNLVCRLLLEKKKIQHTQSAPLLVSNAQRTS